MDHKRKDGPAGHNGSKHKRQKLDVSLVDGSSSGLSSVNEGDSDSDASLRIFDIGSEGKPSQQPSQPAQSGKRPAAPSTSNKLPFSGPNTPQPHNAPSSSPDKFKTSQKGVGMSRTVLPSAAANPPQGSSLFSRAADSSPEVSLSKLQQRHAEALQAEAAVQHQEDEAYLSQQVKAEEIEDESLDALAAGMPIDVNALSTNGHGAGIEGGGAAAQEKERPAVTEERERIIVFHTVSNSESPLTPATLIILTGLKNIFMKQLPKMPREYIARLVFDREHWSMAIVKRGYQVVGGITYRPFAQRGFAEIVFCAITGTEQVRGYGSHLMNHLKDYVRAAHPGVNNFLTYADNYAVGYFKKQGFTKEVSLDRALWAAYIKDYEGGTLMQCTMLPRLSYLDSRTLLARQKEAILAKIRLVSRSHIVYRGRDIFPDDSVTHVDPDHVPGLKEVGWNPQMDELTRKPQRGPHHMILQRLLTDLQNHPSAWPFMKPVNREEVADYYEVIKHPMDLETMELRLESNHYDSVPAFLADAQLIFDNCRAYNAETSNYAKNATRLEKYLKERHAVYVDEI